MSFNSMSLFGKILSFLVTRGKDNFILTLLIQIETHKKKRPDKIPERFPQININLKSIFSASSSPEVVSVGPNQYLIFALPKAYS